MIIVEDNYSVSVEEAKTLLLLGLIYGLSFVAKSRMHRRITVQQPNNRKTAVIIVNRSVKNGQ